MNIYNKLFGILLFIGLAIGVMYSRVKFRCHTIQQVILGGLFGSIFAKLYYDNKNTIKKFLNI